ncbi:carboxypeptidase regulatory-like domain-containing protein [Sphingomonas sp.]|jgi:hypothetical protein|uniref:carboxypeptidase regulatory-like domain-containing protein n=1 Tax=Sphingomonas sp. TaxID=28214 RepID=UPI002ED8C963
MLPAILTTAVVLAWARLAWWQASAPRAVRARGWRVGVLAAMQAVCAALLYCTLAPPTTPGAVATLIVATAQAPRTATAAAIVALPEAPTLAGVERMPDLATALRRHPGTARIRVVGEGLEPRDVPAVQGQALAFDPPRPPRGLVGLAPPAPAAPGAAYRIGGRVLGVAGGRVELLDPAGARIDVVPLDADGGFRLTGTARAAGVALARVRVRDAAGRSVEEAEVPIRTVDDPQPRLLLLAGAAHPEVKYLRRWATDAGLAVTTRIAAGAGVVLGDAPVLIDSATLARFDAAIIDERSWAGLAAGQRAAVAGAVRSGMGLILRITGPVPAATSRQWRSLGVAVGSAGKTMPAPLASGVPILNRRTVASSADAVPVWRDARGAVLADWRALGRGRVALWAVDDAFALVLSGHGDRYGGAWASALAAVSRARDTRSRDITPLPRAGERMTLCAISPAARVEAPGDDGALQIDGSSGGCAGYWPRRAGWHALVDRGQTEPFYVYPPDALPGVRAQARIEATARLRRMTAPTDAAKAAPGASWPWFLAFLVAAASLWWFERARYGRRAAAPAADAA